ncbi:cytochrome c oxidase assembly protein [Kocuria sp. SM24M-10]|uniref:cytochrome c oxidase assembly protein n=1 Tax=Kocuria sp. SM24M-10 TaxID=1660349 RepID=UPI0009E51E1B|nr:cytochrome c oxidase assembly protein [Kocuria sp. SM24M-10]
MSPHHGGADWAAVEAVAVLALAAGAAGYAAALWAARHRSPWPVRRTVLWFAGLGCAGASLLGPLAAAAHGSFAAHMVVHLLLGMAAPLLLVLGAPVTLALRALPVAGARCLARLLRSRPVRVLSHPVVAGTLNAGGLWVLYSTGLYAAMHASAPVHAAVHAHVLLAGYLFTAAVVGVDTDPHRGSLRLRAAVLVGYLTVHAVLAKRLYGDPPAGVGTADAQLGSRIMYYGGDAVDVALLVVFFAQWYAAGRTRAAPAAAWTAGLRPPARSRPGPRARRRARRAGPG